MGFNSGFKGLNRIPNRYGKCLVKGHSYFKMSAFGVLQEEEKE